MTDPQVKDAWREFCEITSRVAGEIPTLGPGYRLLRVSDFNPEAPPATAFQWRECLKDFNRRLGEWFIEYQNDALGKMTGSLEEAIRSGLQE